jgi:hypothetical protein
MESGEKWPVNFACDSACRKSAHEANGFASFLKEGMLRIFCPKKSDGFGRVLEASMLTARPPKPLH